MSQLIAAKTAADTTGTEFTVTTATSIWCYDAEGSEPVGIVNQKNSDDSWSPLKASFDTGKAPVQVVLTGVRTSALIVQPGTYQFIKYETTGTVGVDYIEG